MKVLSKLKHCTTQSVLKVVYNSSIHPYLNYSILNWGRASNATIQPLIKFQNKALKLRRPTNTASLEETFQHLNILCVPILYTRGGQLVFDWDRLENFLITRDRPGGYKVTNTKYHEMQRFSFLFTF